jgi:integrase
MANLIKRGDIYYAEVRIPSDVKSIFSKSVFRRSTGCKDRRNAELEAAPWISSWWKEIKEARANPEEALEKVAALMARHYEEDLRGDYWDYEHEYVDGVPTGRKQGYTDAETALSDYMEDLRIKLPPSEYAIYADIYSGKTGIPIGLFVDRWISDEYSTNTPRTQREASTSIKAVTQYFPTVNDFTVPNRQRWLKHETRARKTVQKEMGYVRSYFLWLRNNQHIGQSQANPFIKDDITWPKRLKEKQSYIPFEVSEVLQLRAAAMSKGDMTLVRFIDIAQYTGMRLAEIAQISQDSVVTKDNVMCLQVKEDAKTDASSNRLVPIASTLNQRVDLAAIPVPSKDDEGQAVGKRFGRLKSKLGFGSLKVFHSIRKTATTVFEQAGVSEGTTADIVGHEKGTITYGLYSGGTSIDQRKTAVDAFETLMLLKEAEASNK